MHILTHFYCTKYNEINIFHSNAQSMVIYRGTEMITIVIWITLGNGSICIFDCVSSFVSITLNFNEFCDACTF